VSPRVGPSCGGEGKMSLHLPYRKTNHGLLVRSLVTIDTELPGSLFRSCKCIKYWINMMKSSRNIATALTPVDGILL
jgi:hypothetical protein